MPKSKHSASMNLPQVEDGQPPHSEEPTKWTEEKDRTVDEDPRFQAEVGEIYRDCSQFQERHMKLALTRETSEDFYKQWKLVMGEKSQLGPAAAEATSDEGRGAEALAGSGEVVGRVPPAIAAPATTPLGQRGATGRQLARCGGDVP